MVRKIINISLFVAVVGLIVSSLAFSSGRLARVKCDEVVVIIPEDSPRFIDEEEVVRLVREAEPKLKSSSLDRVNTNLLEQKLQKNPAIKKAEVYRHISGKQMSFKGELMVEVQQREPLFRVMTDKDDYYMDHDGVRIPANPQFASHVVLVSGMLNDKFTAQQLVPLIAFIHSDPFWNAQIKQVEVTGKGELTMVPLVGEQLIEFGDVLNYREKLRNLKALYEQAMPKAGWDKYRKISLKYKNQVVCTRKGEMPLAKAPVDSLAQSADSVVAKPVKAPATAVVKPKIAAKTPAKATNTNKTKARVKPAKKA
ncbi:MAG: cell division protein FtsQ/DivIB [Mangrovibacterium sp.]